jgi:hypothetical protein
MLELCDIIHQQGEPLFSPEEKPNDPRVVISFGELFSVRALVDFKMAFFVKNFKSLNNITSILRLRLCNFLKTKNRTDK